MNNFKKMLLITITCALTLTMSGCWNYRGLNELVIVSGVAIDKDFDHGLYKVSFEILQPNISENNSNTKTRLVISEGKTIFDALRNARNKTAGKLYLGNSQVIIVSKRLAETENMSSYIDVFIRDGEPRETANLIISQEETAEDIFKAKPMDQNILSYQIDTEIKNDSKSTSNTNPNPVYEIFNCLKSEGCELVTPAIRLTEGKNEINAEIYGTAVFKDEKLIGFISPEESKYLLLVNNKMQGGIITLLSSENGCDLISLEICGSTAKTKVEYVNDKIQITINTKTCVFLGENGSDEKFSDVQNVNSLEEMAGDKIKEQITALINKAQKDLRSDFFCFGNLLYKSNIKQWKQISDRWDELFSEAEITVNSKVVVRNTALIMET